MLKHFCTKVCAVLLLFSMTTYYGTSAIAESQIDDDAIDNVDNSGQKRFFMVAGGILVTAVVGVGAYSLHSSSKKVKKLSEDLANTNQSLAFAFNTINAQSAAIQGIPAGDRGLKGEIGAQGRQGNQGAPAAPVPALTGVQILALLDPLVQYQAAVYADSQQGALVAGNANLAAVPGSPATLIGILDTLHHRLAAAGL